MSGRSSDTGTDAAVDARFMAAALAFGRRGLGRTATNPSVGALVVRDGIVVGRGRTGDGGRPHAETIALAQAGCAAQGATLYVTLEPCSHHGATPPCCEAVAAAGIARVVYAIGDPNPLVAGRGVAFCRARGIAVTGDVAAAEARADLRNHLLRVATGRPAVTLKLAETPDGFVAGGAHDSRLAITGAAANGMVHVLRAMHDALMVGIGTAVADDPLLTVRLPGVEARPLRIVLDADLTMAPRSRLVLTAGEVPLLLVAREGVAVPAGLAERTGVEILRAPTTADGRLDLAAVLAMLGSRGLTRLFSEGGPRVAASLIAAGHADEVLLFTGARALGRDGVPGLGPAEHRNLRERYALVEERSVGADRLRRYVLES